MDNNLVIELQWDDVPFGGMPDKLYKAAESDDDGFIDNNWGTDKYYFSEKTGESNNILHIAILHNSWRFALKAMSLSPHLVFEKNKDGISPLHIAAEKGDSTEELLFVGNVCKQWTDYRSFRVKNSDGNTPLHVALMHRQFKFACLLAEKDLNSATVVNASNESPIHITLKHFPDVERLDKDREQDQHRFTRLMEQKGATDENVVQPRITQDYVGMIRLLLEKANYVTEWRDHSGLTPLHRAASLPTTYNLAVAKYIIESYPQSIEVCDNSGKTVLHHLINRISYVREGLHFLCNTPVHNLVNHQDEDGNTPAHLAVINKDINMLQLLKHFYRSNWGLKNNEGLTPTALLKQHNLTQIVEEQSMMTKKVRLTAKYADVRALQKHLVEKKDEPSSLWSQDRYGRNLVHRLFQIKSRHVIVSETFICFIKDYVGKDMQLLLRGTDKDGNTPFHILAQLDHDNIMIHLAKGLRLIPTPTRNLYKGPKPFYSNCLTKFYQKYEYSYQKLRETNFLTEVLNASLYFFDREWLTQNAKGNTALHEALIAKNYPLFIRLAEFDEGATASVNKRIPAVAEDVVENIITNNTQNDHFFCNKDGMTPLFLALKAGNIEFAAKLCSICPRLAERRDANGQTFWHELVNLPPIEPPFNFANSSFTEDTTVCFQLAAKDSQEKTALHRAIECSRFDLAETFLRIFQEHPFNIPDNDNSFFCNEDGLSLLVLTLRAGNIEFAAKLCSSFPRLVRCRDDNGKTFWHELVDLPPIEPSFNFFNSSFAKEVVCLQLATKDSEGKTALHRAIERRRFDLAETFLRLGEKLKSDRTPIFQEHLLKVPNNDNITPANMIGELSFLPIEFEEFIKKEYTMIGIRSVWGVPSTQMQSYVSTIALAAAAVITVAITISSTVSSGDEKKKGTPSLMKDASIQLFIIINTATLCLSLMVLFCCLLIPTTGNKSHALILLDLSISMIQMSLQLTVASFILGLYAGNNAFKLWVAIGIFTLGVIAIMFMHQNVANKLIIPSWKVVLIYLDKAYRNAEKYYERFKERHRRRRSSSRSDLVV
ncbi:Protein ACCELERATED CELL DEATH 6 [Bienertia sinuspersici]